MGRRTPRTAGTPLVAVTTVAALLFGALVGVLVGPAGVAGAGVPTAAGSWRPPGHTITRVVGDAANGFTIHRYDGSRLHPPTHSEAMAECGEYDTAVARVRCRAEVRTWYRDLAETKRAIRWARYDARR